MATVGENGEIQSSFAEKVNSYLAATLQDHEEVDATDMMMVFASWYVRMRTVLTSDEIRAGIITYVHAVEQRLQQGNAVLDMEGNPTNVVLAEERRMAPDLDFSVPDTIPEEWQ